MRVRRRRAKDFRDGERPGHPLLLDHFFPLSSSRGCSRRWVRAMAGVLVIIFSPNPPLPFPPCRRRWRARAVGEGGGGSLWQRRPSPARIQRWRPSSVTRTTSATSTAMMNTSETVPNRFQDYVYCICSPYTNGSSSHDGCSPLRSCNWVVAITGWQNA
uniref:Uncharacterized protein n=1 Tax=Oryza barthii TaxID=65489 RepID=A0A0D3HU63_9ORYZ